MTVELANEIWSELKRYVNTVDRDDAAETLVSVLIDNDVGADEIKDGVLPSGHTYTWMKRRNS